MWTCDRTGTTSKTWSIAVSSCAVTTWTKQSLRNGNSKKLNRRPVAGCRINHKMILNCPKDVAGVGEQILPTTATENSLGGDSRKCIIEVRHSCIGRGQYAVTRQLMLLWLHIKGGSPPLNRNFLEIKVDLADSFEQ